MATATHLINRTPSKTLNLKAPINLLSSEYPYLCLKTNLSAKIFGCIVYVHLHHTGKLDHRAIKCIFLGYSTTQKGYKCYHPSSRKFFITADAKFDDFKMFYDEASRSEGYLDSMAQEVGKNDDHRMSQLELPSLAPGINESTPDVSIVPSPIEGEVESHTPQNTQYNAEMLEGGDISSNNRWSIAVSKGVRNCTQTKPYPVSNYLSYTRMSQEDNRVIQTLMTISVPKNVQEAISSNEWKKAMDEEMEALEKNGTWEMGPLPVGKKLVGSRWVFTIKYHSDGSVARYKARLVARGYTQSYGIDYNETFAPVAKLNTIRILMALAALFDWKLFQFDVKNAFLHGELEEEVYMAPPPGYLLETNNTGDVCHLRKSIYGLKQSPRAWFGKFFKTMLSARYAQSEGDHTLFIKHGKEGKVAILIEYVDNIVVTGNDVAEIQNLKKHLASSFDIKALGLLSYFLGIEVAYSASGIVLSQHNYIIDHLKDTGKLDCRPAVTPVDVNVN